MFSLLLLAALASTRPSTPALHGPSHAAPCRQRHRRTHRTPGSRRGEALRDALGASPASRAADLYSLHARRRAATYLRLRLLELREEGLDRAVDVIEGRLPVDILVPPLHR
ncbi:MAG: hypothetical protein ACREM2_03815 [Vulcanimicrobiaceae bacterium]